ncbi:MAG: IS1380 family transposase, partial [Bacteroidales bacterium]|nr:IS1380 family transposase [Bacteroidales bacterium]
KISVTKQKISGRGGITLFLRYVEKTMFYSVISQAFSKLGIFGSKGLQLNQFTKQMLAFFIDGTDMSISGFDRKKQDESYAAVLENSSEEMASSHQIKRFFRKISIVPAFVFRKILKTLFIWRLNIKNPQVVELFIDTMVLNNDDALKREGVEPTYKPVKGFQPLHIAWDGKIVDLLFRKGSSHSNHETDYTDIVRDIVKLIRKKYSKTVPIIVNTDSGFFDQKAFDYFEQELKIHYVSTATLYPTIKKEIVELKKINQELINEKEAPIFNTYEKGKQVWNYIEFGSKLKSWKKFRRCVYTELSNKKDGQFLLDFHKSDSAIYTNIGINSDLDTKLKGTKAENYFTSEGLIKFSHSKGKDELVHRSLKEFATKEQLPFEKFKMNMVYYYLLVITHFLFETYKIDVTHEVVPMKSYPNTFRRQLIDFAVKIVSHSGYKTLQVVETVYNNLKIKDLWLKCQTPPQILLIN